MIAETGVDESVEGLALEAVASDEVQESVKV